MAAVEKRRETKVAAMERYIKEVDFEEVIKSWGAVDVGRDIRNDISCAQGYSLPADSESK